MARHGSGACQIGLRYTNQSSWVAFVFAITRVFLLVQTVRGMCVLKSCQQGIRVKAPWYDCLNDSHLLCDHPLDSNFSLASSSIEREGGPLSGFEIDCYGQQDGLNHVEIKDANIFDKTWMRIVKITDCDLRTVTLDLYYEGFFELNLRSNEIGTLSNLTVEDTAAILSVDLSFNLLSSIAEMTDRDNKYHWITRVKYWNFDSNQIRKLKPGLFRNVPKFFDYVNLSNNKILSIPKLDFGNTTSGIVILLLNNYIGNIADGAFEGARIQTLDLSENYLKTINSDTFSNAQYIQELVLSNNRIFRIETFSLEIHGLVTLKLRNNKLFGISDNVFSNLQYLQFLDLSHNSITEIEYGSFTGLDLQLLDLSHNPILQLPGRIFPLTKISKLNLADCLMKNFPSEVVERLRDSLRYLNLSRNMIHAFPKSSDFSTNSGFSFLDLSYNRLDSFDCSLLRSTFPLLTKLYLHGNALREIGECIALVRLRLTLRENHLDCCVLGWLKQLNRVVDVIADADQVWCEWPHKVRFLDGDITFKELCNFSGLTTRPIPTLESQEGDRPNKDKESNLVFRIFSSARANKPEPLVPESWSGVRNQDERLIVNAKSLKLVNPGRVEFDINRDYRDLSLVGAHQSDPQHFPRGRQASKDDDSRSWKGATIASIVIICFLCLVVVMVLTTLLS